MGVLLAPLKSLVPEIDIVAKGLLFAAPEIRNFLAKPIILPVIIERHYFGYAHKKNEESSSVSLGAASTDDPVPN